MRNYSLASSCGLRAFILIFMLMPSCEKSFFFTSEPDITTKTILNPFTEIMVNGIFDIRLMTDTEYSIQMTGKTSILEKISFIQDGNSLILYDRNPLQWLPDYPRVILTISFPDLRTLTLNSPSRIVSEDTLRITSLDIISTGRMNELDLAVDASNIYLGTVTDDFGYYILKGNSVNVDFHIFGSARIKADDLRANNVSVRNYGIGNSHVYAAKSLRVWLGHYGNIFYRGTPDEITIELMNSRGRLIKIND
jgi:hypothetical protein